ncbi:hypothetical protein SteCoe_15213 [Stentor coeruleus]|uniref:Uncharacterized protein n=1 Tax=Stentor coeruleus TaxID=5963 RepID=A0A1R2C448_9CILI|nr:hypothetical protein SteCoe_15213 [Stentor coeruleus]
MHSSGSHRILADITSKIQNTTETAQGISNKLSIDINEELSLKTLGKIKKMSKKNNKLSKNIQKQIDVFKEASKILVDTSIENSSKIGFLADEISFVKKNIVESNDFSQSLPGLHRSRKLNKKLSKFKEMYQHIADTNKKIIESEKQIFEKELENLELQKRLQKVEESISMYMNEKEQKCTCIIL